MDSTSVVLLADAKDAKKDVPQAAEMAEQRVAKSAVVRVEHWFVW